MITEAIAEFFKTLLAFAKREQTPPLRTIRQPGLERPLFRAEDRAADDPPMIEDNQRSDFLDLERF